MFFPNQYSTVVVLYLFYKIYELFIYLFILILFLFIYYKTFFSVKISTNPFVLGYLGCSLQSSVENPNVPFPVKHGADIKIDTKDIC